MAATEFEDGSVDASVATNIFHRENVVLLVSEKANDTTSAERNCCLTHSHGKPAYLLTFVAKKNILNRSYLHLHSWVASLLKPQPTVLDGQCPGRILPSTFEPQKMSNASTKRCGIGGSSALLTK